MGVGREGRMGGLDWTFKSRYRFQKQTQGESQQEIGYSRFSRRRGREMQTLLDCTGLGAGRQAAETRREREDSNAAHTQVLGVGE